MNHYLLHKMNCCTGIWISVPSFVWRGH